MRTTIDINDEVLRAVKSYAAEERKTLKVIFEQLCASSSRTRIAVFPMIHPSRRSADGARNPAWT